MYFAMLMLPPLLISLLAFAFSKDKITRKSILRRRGALQQYKEGVPAYPGDVYDYYRPNCLVNIGVTLEDIKAWQWLLENMNADIGPAKEASVILFFTSEKDSAYEYAVEEAWLGGKKNDIIVLIGAPEAPKISWVLHPVVDKRRRIQGAVAR